MTAATAGTFAAADDRPPTAERGPVADEVRGGRTQRIVRAPNHLGDVVLALPALVADGSDVLVRSPLAPVLRMGGIAGRVLPFERGPAGWTAAVRELRGRRYEECVLLTPSFSAAWLARWGGVARLRGTDTDGRGPLLSERVSPGALRPHHRIDQYKLLLGQDVSRPARLLPVVPPPEVVARWRARLEGRTTGSADAGHRTRPGGAPPSSDAALVALFPGSNAPARRWPAERFRDVARAVAARGARLVVLGGPSERELTGHVAAAVPGSVDLGGRTDLVDLAAVLSLCDLVVTNDTGPMHLAGAVGTPTVTLWGPSDPREVGQRGSVDVRVVGPELPCKPCFANHCPRRGRGTLLDRAHEECMRLIEPSEVVEAVERLMRGARDA